jgi:glutathione S-transferase
MAFGVVNTPEYRALNPNGLVPVLIDGDMVLWESNAIVRYVAAAYGAGALWPVDPKARAQSDKWMDWSSMTFYPAFIQAFFGLVRTPPEKRDLAAIEASRAKTEEVMGVLDSLLGQQPYVGGDTFTMGDISIGVGVHRWLNMPVTRQARPNIETYYARLIERPAAKAALVLPVT